MRRLLLLTLCLFALPGAGWPVDWVHQVEVGQPKGVKLPQVDWFEVDDPKVLSVEWVAEANELVLVGLKPGRATVLLGAQGKVAAWRVRVSSAAQLDSSLLSAAKKACPDFSVTPSDEVKLTVTVLDERCHQALLKLFQTDAFEARHLALTLEGKELQAQLRSLQEGLAKVVGGKVKARYVGAGLVLDGQVSTSERRQVLWEILRRTLGRFALDDQTQTLDAAASP